MTWLDRLRSTVRHLIRNLLRRDRVEEELSREADDYLEMLVGGKTPP